MKEQSRKRYLPAVIVRWVARVLSVLCVGIILLFIVGEGGLSHPVRFTLREGIGLLCFPLGVTVGMVLAWWREGIGAAVTIGSLAAFYLLYTVLWSSFPGGPFFLIFSLPGFIFGLA